ncbi:MAG TPA: GerMN domain-containing protein [Candidatus Lachnoclostridium pullistercoris]|uniref:GerMN domain-containing protein n=1 Tax=Candidatus Lachnoclostridium pullistercoris TaxID=2838632 RepID=A0A9D2PFP2_9FIRM|nr:GerMN domain-containing protein [Candidatus Lachnoclostridium pullistercoris]
MKKIALCITGALLAVSMAACSPTQKETDPAAVLEQQSTGSAEDKVPDPTTEVLEIASIYVPDEERTGLKQAMEGLSTLDAESLVAKLVEYGVLPEDCQVLSYETEGEEDGSSAGPGAEAGATVTASAVLNLSDIPDGDNIDKQLITAAIGNTITENLGVRSLTIQENGTVFADGVTFQNEYETLITE